MINGVYCHEAGCPNRAWRPASRVTTREYANGIACTYRALTILFPFGFEPKLLFGRIPTSITNPERFGAWDTDKARRAYVRAFFKAEVITAR